MFIKISVKITFKIIVVSSELPYVKAVVLLTNALTAN